MDNTTLHLPHATQQTLFVDPSPTTLATVTVRNAPILEARDVTSVVCVSHSTIIRTAISTWALPWNPSMVLSSLNMGD